MPLIVFTICIFPIRTFAFSGNWYKAANGEMRIKNNLGADITNAWICDDADTVNPGAWYFIGSDGNLVHTGIVMDQNGNSYAIETSGENVGMMRQKTGTYEGINLDIDTTHTGFFGRIKNSAAADEMAKRFGITHYDASTAKTVYTKSFIGPSSRTYISSGSYDDYQKRVLSGINSLREKAGVEPLLLDAEITECAKTRCLEAMTCFSHERPDGSRYNTVLDDRGINGSNYGEVLAHGYKTPEAVVEGWHTSPPHYEVITFPAFKKIGISMTENNGVRY